MQHAIIALHQAVMAHCMPYSTQSWMTATAKQRDNATRGPIVATNSIGHTPTLAMVTKYY